ncbi:hypothetical protein AB0F17_44295 [Nonomuraea sp. NPDC026600]
MTRHAELLSIGTRQRWPGWVSVVIRPRAAVLPDPGSAFTANAACRWDAG